MEKDLEANSKLANFLNNDIVSTFTWRNIDVVVKDRRTRQPLSILTAANGHVAAGQVLALMGPSGSGKTTLLNVLAHRTAAANAHVTGLVLANRQVLRGSQLKQLSCYVEQEDSLIGSLTVRETIEFAAKLALPRSIKQQDRAMRVTSLIKSFGLERQADTIVGTPIRKGISGGQKRRLGVASQLVTCPKILFLDEPTSGLDSAASYEVLKFIKDIAVQHNLIVIASIHQPSTTTFELCDQLMLLSRGKTCYFGTTSAVASHFANISYPIPLHTNPAEYLLDLVNDDFLRDGEHIDRTKQIVESWAKSQACQTLMSTLSDDVEGVQSTEMAREFRSGLDTHSKLFLPVTLLHRNFIKSYRDVIAYGIRIAMYLGLAIMMGTVWLRLGYDQAAIQPFINAIFFGGAFMSFMGVAYVPAIIEDLQTFKKERANGFYGPLPFVLANFTIGLPYLFLISVLFSVVAYWLSNFRADAVAFWTWVMWLFLDLLAAEGLVVLVTSVAPIFVVSLAVTAFANGLWMSVGGFLVPLGTLNVFWKYVFHYIDYQAYVFQGMMVNEFQHTIWKCQDNHCLYSSDLESQGNIRGTAILKAYNIGTGKTGEWVGIMIAIIFAYRILGYLALRLRT